MKTILGSLLLLAGGLRASAAPDLTLYPAAKNGMASMAVPVGVRATGMGEAYTAAGGDVNSLSWNPAGLARIGGYQLGLMHNEWSSELGLRQEYLAYGMSLGQDSGLGASINYFSLGSLAERSSTGALGSESGAFAFAGTLGYAQSFLSDEKLKIGAAAEFGQESLFQTGTSAFGGSLGFLYEFSHAFSVGFSALHLGTAGGGFSTPGTLDLGTAYAFNNRAVILALDGDMPMNGAPALKAGAEVNFSSLALRGGWRQQFGAPDGDPGSGFTVGAGFKSGVFALDYAFVPYGDLSTAHRVAATIDLPADFFKPKIVGADSSTTTARTYYDKGLNEERDGNLLQALVQFQRAKDAYPPDLVQQKKVQNFYKTTLDKIASIQKEMSKSGSNEQVRKLVATAIKEGQQAMDQRKYREASRKFRDALALEKGNKQATDLLEEAQVSLRKRKRDLLNEASNAYDGNKLSEAIQKYREVLALDDGDEDAQSFFANHNAEIKEHLRKIHRRGIDLYVSGRIKDAIAMWKGGRVLDPGEKEVNFSRDIEKAEKVLEVRGSK
jgi:tetratricopeptide (TPR) repeat protein